MPGPLPTSPPFRAPDAPSVSTTRRPVARWPSTPAPSPASTSAGSPPTTPPTSVTRPRTTRSTWCSACGSTRSARSTTCRTSRTSTTRCWSGPTPPASDWTALAERETALFREDMTALRMLPPAHYIGAVEAIPGIVPLVERLRDAGAAYELDGDIYFSVECDPHFGKVSGLDAAAMRRAVRRARRRPGPAGQEEPARPDAVAGRPPGRAELGRRVPGPRPARLAHRVRGHRAGPPRHGLRRPGRRLRPGLPAPRDGRLARPGAHRRVPVREGVRPRGHGRARRREDVQVQGQPGLRLRAARARASTRRRSGSPCSRTTTGPTGSGPTRCSPRRSSGWGAGGRPSPGPTGRRRRRWSRRCGTRSRTTWTLRVLWLLSTAGPRLSPPPEEGTPGRPGSSPELSMPSSGSPSNPLSPQLPTGPASRPRWAPHFPPRRGHPLRPRPH